MGRVNSAQSINMTPCFSFVNVSVSEDMILEPMSEYILQCFIDCGCNCLDRLSFIFTPYNDKLAKKCVLVATSIVKPVANFVPCRVINVSSESVKLYKGTRVGFMESAVEIDAKELNCRLVNSQVEDDGDKSYLDNIVSNVKSNENLTEDQVNQLYH